MNIERAYDSLTEWLDCKVSRWYAFPVFGVTLGLVWWLVGDVLANFYISIVTVAFFFLFAYGQRKDRLANQRKHDEEIHAIAEASDDVADLESKTLSEIEGVKK